MRKLPLSRARQGEFSNGSATEDDPTAGQDAEQILVELDRSTFMGPEGVKDPTAALGTESLCLCSPVPLPVIPNLEPPKFRSCSTRWKMEEPRSSCVR